MTETTDTAPELLRAPDVQALTGVTYRQLDYWCSCGYIQPAGAEPSNAGAKGGTHIEDIAAPGSGRAKLWSPSEVEIIRRMVLLIQVGLLVEVAAQAARVEGPVSLGHGIVLTAPWSAT